MTGNISEASRTVRVGGLEIANNRPLCLIAGPCQLESRDHALMIAESLQKASAANNIGLIFKGSFDKANRTSLSGKRGLGIDEGLNVLASVKSELGCPVLTDVHAPEQCGPVGDVVDVLQIPAFLCRQTDLLQAAGASGKAVNIKKGQFLAPWEIPNAAEKTAFDGNHNILLTERGTSFGYNTLVADMRSLPQMAQTGYPVIMDCTHSVAQPGGKGTSSGGQREFAPVMARAAVSVGVAGVFIETHQDPDNAPSDGPNMIPLDQMAALLAHLSKLDELAKSDPVTLN